MGTYRTYSYLFVWDNEKDEVIESYFIYDFSMKEEDYPKDTTNGGVLKEEKMEFTENLSKKYPSPKYTIGLGSAPTFQSLIEDYFDLADRDYDSETDFNQYIQNELAKGKKQTKISSYDAVYNILMKFKGTDVWTKYNLDDLETRYNRALKETATGVFNEEIYKKLQNEIQEILNSIAAHDADVIEKVFNK